VITALSKEGQFGPGLIVSIGLHIALILLVIMGLPIFWQPEPLPEVIGIQSATMADVTAAIKAAKKSPTITKGADTPKPVEQKQPPKPDTPPPPPVQQTQSAPPPPQTQAQPQPTPAAPPKVEEAEKIPDKTKKPEEKKPEEKKPEEAKPDQKTAEKKPDEKPKKPDKADKSLDSLLNDVLKQQPAPDTKADKTKKNAPAPATEQASAPDTPMYSEIPLSASESNGIADQVRGNWNIGSLAGAPDFDKLIVTMHVSLLPDGTITAVTYDNDQPSNPYFRQAAESGRRALLMTKQLKLPPGKTYEKITFQFQPSLMQ
jgi:hypothetical protein